MLESDPLIIWAYLRVEPRSTADLRGFFADLRPGTGISVRAIYRAISRLRRAGATIAHRHGRYHLLDSPPLHHPFGGHVEVRGRGAARKLCLRNPDQPKPPRLGF